MIIVEVPACPPSLNQIASKGSHWKYTAAKKEWHELLRPRIEAGGLHPCSHVFAEGEVTFPDRRKRDQGNFRMLLEKALGDVLVAGGWLPDDDWDHYEFGALTRTGGSGTPLTRLVLMST